MPRKSDRAPGPGAGAAARLGAAALLLLASSCGDRQTVPPDFDPGPTPTEFAAGESLFTARCVRCHGAHALGADSGPPLVHSVYHPAHHADEAFQRAVALGVSPHHWGFGPMAPVPGLDRDQVAEIIAYVRWIQRQAGIR